MRICLRKFIVKSTLAALIVTRVFFAVPYALAIPEIPSAPGMPRAPSLDNPPPSMPASSQEIPTAPAMPTSENSNPPTNAPIPTQVSSSSEPTQAPLPTNGSSDPTGSPTLEESTDGTSSNGGSSDSSPTSTITSAKSPGDVNDPANTNTGTASQNAAYEKLDKEMETLNKNLAQLQNKIDAATKTGFNYANLNTLSGNVFSGNANTQMNLLNKLNSNMSGAGDFAVFNVYDTHVGDIVFQLAGNNVTNSFDAASTTVSKNAATGTNSTNNAIAENNFQVKEANGNDAKIENDINLSAVTGSNSASYNTGGGNITTGDAAVSGSIINLANTNLNVSNWLIGVVNIWGTLIGDIILPKDTAGSSNTTAPVMVGNSATGPLSDNSASYTSNETASFQNNNTAVIESSIDTSANTGNNTSSANTGGGSVVTGNGNIAVSETTVANTNTVNEEGTVWMIIVNEAGRWVGHIIGEPWGETKASNSLPVSSGNGTPAFSTMVENSATGPGSSNNSSYTQNSDTVITNDNKATIDNNIQATADTGNNEAAYNTGSGNIETGNATVGLNVLNMTNTNVTAKKFVAIIVNVLGDFLGNVVPVGVEESSSILPPIGNPVIPTEAPSLPDLPEATPMPTIAPAAVIPTPTITYIYEYYYYAQAQAPTAYNQAVQKVNNLKKNVTFYQPQTGYYALNQVNIPTQAKYTRGLFLSPAFAKAVESSFPGMLFGGASLKVDQSWLWVIPAAIFILVLRRRKKYQIGKNFYRLMELVL